MPTVPASYDALVERLSFQGLADAFVKNETERLYDQSGEVVFEVLEANLVRVCAGKRRSSPRTEISSATSRSLVPVWAA